jgi:hypothetical protein
MSFQADAAPTVPRVEPGEQKKQRKKPERKPGMKVTKTPTAGSVFETDGDYVYVCHDGDTPLKVAVGNLTLTRPYM